MDAKLVMSVEQMEKDRDAWLKLRNTGIGGSDAAIIVGLSHWRSPFQLWALKTGQVVEDEIDNDFLHFGRVLEQVVADEFELRTGKKVRRCGMLQNNTYPWLLASVDRLVVGEDTGLECKTAASWKADEWDEDSLPDSYYIQCCHYCLVTGFKEWWIAVLIGGNKFIYKKVTPSEEDLKMLFEAEKKFWEENVIAKALPDIDGSVQCNEWLRSIYKGGDTEAKDLDDEWDILLNDMDDLKKDKKKVEEAIRLRENKLREFLGNTEFARSRRWNIFYKPRPSRRFDVEQFTKDYPQLAEKYTKTSSARPLYIRISKARTKEE